MALAFAAWVSYNGEPWFPSCVVALSAQAAGNGLVNPLIVVSWALRLSEFLLIAGPPPDVHSRNTNEGHEKTT
jgi:hypothetical protein